MEEDEKLNTEDNTDQTDTSDTTENNNQEESDSTTDIEDSENNEEDGNITPDDEEDEVEEEPESTVTRLNITPSTYTFTSLNEVTSIFVDTDAPTVTFERVNKYGTGIAEYDHATKMLTAKAYGKGLYRFKAQAAGKKETTVDFNIEVARPIINNTVIDKLVNVSNDVFSDNTIDIEIPDGYKIKLYDPIELKEPIADIDPDVGIEAKYLGEMSYSIVVEKENPLENEKNIEYVYGTVNLTTYKVILEPNKTDIFTKLRKTYEVSNLKVLVGSNNKGVKLTFKDEQSTITDETEGTEKEITDTADTNSNVAVNTDANDSEDNTIPPPLDPKRKYDKEVTEIVENDSYSYTVRITGVNPGDGIFKAFYNIDNNILTFNINVVDEKIFTISPDEDTIFIPFKETFVFKELFYTDNDEPTEVVVVPPIGASYKTLLEEIRPNSKKYKLTITPTYDRGGTSDLLLKSINGNVGQRFITVTTLKEVKEGNITLSPSLNDISINAGRSYNYLYISATESDDIIIENPDDQVCEVRLEALVGDIFIKNDDNEEVKVEFPEYSKQYKLFIIGKNEGKINIKLKGIVNTDDVTCETTIKVNVLPSDKLPDESSVVNLYALRPPKNRVGDILIDLPKDSSTLVHIDEVNLNTVIEYGFSYDYQSEENPTKDTNPVLQNDKTGYPTWLNLKTNEIFMCLDITTDENIWYGNKGTWINRIVYPEPGEKGFGVGPAPKLLAEEYGLKECKGCWDRNSDNYGNYYDKYYTKYVFIPVHCIIPKYNSDLLDKYPYDGIEYLFSWHTDDDTFTTNTIPRCFINSGNTQPGVFVSKYNGEIYKSGYNENIKDIELNSDVSRTSTNSLYAVYKTSDNNEVKNQQTLKDANLYPELIVMGRTCLPDNSTGVSSKGRHNMSIFIQTMINNLGDLHTIASFEKNVSEDICYKLKYLASATWFRRTKLIESNGGEKQEYEQIKAIPTGITSKTNEYIHSGKNTGSIHSNYRRLFSHNGQECGVFDTNGPANVGLTGILVVQDNVVTPNNYKVYSLKKTVDIAEIERLSFLTIKSSNTESLIFKTPLFNLNNYDLIATIKSNTEVSNMLYLNTSKPYNTHNKDQSLLESGLLQQMELNSGLNLSSILDYSKGLYAYNYNGSTDSGMRTNKFKYSMFNMGFLNKFTNMQIEDKVWYGFFTSNYTPVGNESEKANFQIDNYFNNPRTRVVRYCGSYPYIKKANSSYMLENRVCITSNIGWFKVPDKPFEPTLEQVVEEEDTIISNTVWYGVSIKEFLLPDEITTILDKSNTDNVFSKYNFPDSGYSYLVIPSYFTKDISFIDPKERLPIALEPAKNITIINDYGVKQKYKVYRSTNILNGPISIEILDYIFETEVVEGNQEEDKKPTEDNKQENTDTEIKEENNETPNTETTKSEDTDNTEESKTEDTIEPSDTNTEQSNKEDNVEETTTPVDENADEVVDNSDTTEDTKSEDEEAVTDTEAPKEEDNVVTDDESSEIEDIDTETTEESTSVENTEDVVDENENVETKVDSETDNKEETEIPDSNTKE